MPEGWRRAHDLAEQFAAERACKNAACLAPLPLPPCHSLRFASKHALPPLFPFALQVPLSGRARDQYQQAWYSAACECLAKGLTPDQAATATAAAQPDAGHGRGPPVPEGDLHAELEAMLLSPVDVDMRAAGGEGGAVGGLPPLAAEVLTQEELALILGPAHDPGGSRPEGAAGVLPSMLGPGPGQHLARSQAEGPGPSSQGQAPLHPPTVEGLDLQSPQLRLAALFCLYCLFSAQPGPQSVKAYLCTEHQRALTGARTHARARGLGSRGGGLCGDGRAACPAVAPIAGRAGRHPFEAGS